MIALLRKLGWGRRKSSEASAGSGEVQVGTAEGAQSGEATRLLSDAAPSPSANVIGQSDLFPPASICLSKEPPDWWLEQERIRLEALYPDLCPDSQDAAYYHFCHQAGDREGSQRYYYSALGIATIVIIDILLRAAFPLFTVVNIVFSMMGLFAVYIATLHLAFLLKVTHLRSVGFFQGIILAQYDLNPLVRSVFTRCSEQMSSYLWGGYLAGGVYYMIKGYQVIGMTGVMLSGVILFICAVFFAALGPQQNDAESNREFLYLSLVLIATRYTASGKLSAVILIVLLSLLVIPFVFIVIPMLISQIVFFLPVSQNIQRILFILLTVALVLGVIDGLSRIFRRLSSKKYQYDELGESP
jgi:hypothetical protein